jgi:hypothetical protein
MASHMRASRWRASYGHIYLMGVGPLGPKLLPSCFFPAPTPAYHCVKWHVVVCAPNSSGQVMSTCCAASIVPATLPATRDAIGGV